MSQQPCLPVGRRRKRHEEEAAPNWGNIESMDATEYLRMVVSEASRLPDVFVADANEDNNSNNNHNGQFDDAEMEVSSDTEPKQEQATENALAKRAATSPSKNGNKKKDTSQKSATFVSGSAAAVEYLVSSRTELVPPPSSGYVPAAGKLWADRTLDAFSRLRSYLEQMEPVAASKDTNSRVPLPPMKDRAGWHEFCVGKADAEGNAGNYFGDDDDEDNDAEMAKDDDDDEDEVPTWKQTMLLTTMPDDGHGGGGGHHYWPTTSLLLQMDQVMVRRVLSHLVYFVCEGWSLTAARSAWIYALAARLDRPVHRDDAVVLYQLLKRLTVLRAQLDIVAAPSSDNTKAAAAASSSASSSATLAPAAQQEEELARINTLILVVAVYLEQGGGYASVMEPRV